MYKKILVLVESAASTGLAVRRAASIATRSGAEIELYGVVYDPHLEGYLGHTEIYAPLRERLVAERRSALDALVVDLEREGLRASAQALWAHSASDVGIREAVIGNADLVVIEPAGLGNKLSHDDFRLISLCPRPVLVARRDDAPSYESVIAAVDPSRTGGKAAGLDAAIVAAAKGMRDLFDARIQLLHSYTPLTEIAADAAFDGVLVSDVQLTFESDRREDVVRLAEQAGLPPDVACIVTGRPADALADRSGSRAAALLVLGTVSRGPFLHFLLGSTAERVLKADGGDVLVVKPPGFRPD
jgi:universal stress protein E